MSEIRYEKPKTVEEAVRLLAEAKGTARVLAGGTDVLVQMRAGRLEPELLVDIKGIEELRAIGQEAGGGYWFGAAVSCMELIEHEGFARTWPGVTDGVKLIGSIQVKGRATVGGNVCNASPAADSVPGLIAAGAVARVVGPYTLLEVTIKTGRTHQIRVHLASQGHPIAGDDKYGDFEHNKQLQKMGLKRMFLHAWQLKFQHPQSGRLVSLQAKLPPELQQFVDSKLENQ